MSNLKLKQEQRLRLSLTADNIARLIKLQCELHTILYEHTCTEYNFLLESEFDSLDEIVSIKENIIIKIQELENERLQALQELQSEIPSLSFKKVGDLINAMKANQLDVLVQTIENLNLVLLDIIDKIQDQNKRNQLFLNKAILSLKDLKASFNKENPKQFKTYNSHGASSSASTR